MDAGGKRITRKGEGGLRRYSQVSSIYNKTKSIRVENQLLASSTTYPLICSLPTGSKHEVIPFISCLTGRARF